MSGLEYIVVDAEGDPVDEGLDVGWVLHETREEAEEVRDRFDDDYPDLGPHRIRERTVSEWRDA